jgi:dihydrofolate reductase
MIITAIVAYDRNFAIGQKNAMPWHLPADLRYFRQQTQGHAVVMGSKTFASIGRPLPKRQNIILSRQAQTSNIPNLIYLQSLTAAIDYAQSLAETELFIIGGGQIYAQALPICHRILATEIETHIEAADTFFPNIHENKDWTCRSRQAHTADDNNPHAYAFCEYQRQL